MTRPSVPAVPDRDTQGRVSYIDVLLEQQPRQVIRGEIVRTDLAPPVGWVPVTDPTTPVFNQVNHDHRWERLLAASRAATAASRTHFLVTMAGRP